MLVTSHLERSIDVEADKAVRLILQSAGLEAMQGSSLRGKTLGIVGCNSFSKEVAKRAEFAFGMQVLRCNPCDRTGLPLSAIMSEADVIFVAAPDTPANTGLISAIRFNQMKPDAVLVALSAMHTIDMRALRHALWFETIGGAAFHPNGLTSDDCVQLSMCDNAVLGASDDAISRSNSTMTAIKSGESTKASMRAA